MNLKVFLQWFLNIVWSYILRVPPIVIAIIGLIAAFYYHRKNYKLNIFPDIVILKPKPKHNYTFRWIPSQELQPIIEPKYPANEAIRQETRLPTFLFKNIGKSVAKNVKIRWQII